MVVVTTRSINRCGREDGVEPAHSLVLTHGLRLVADSRRLGHVRNHGMLVTGRPLRLLIEMVQRVLHDLADPRGRE
ncbi:hypothetical protein SDC9_105236 [bioreactor metagenome]|uniref:Uncharacterized protein n=1 Tax=bioreactor metagenome TaxID=1076179 RepID=A0A645AYS9_9ZZZZ